MTSLALDALARFNARLAPAFVLTAAAALYVARYNDPYIVLLMTPFFALGCARGKHPIILLALSLAPATLLLLISAVKFSLLGMPLVVYDHYFLRKNLLILAYNDWRVASGLAIAAVLIVLYGRVLMSGRGAFTRFERWTLSGLVVISILCIAALKTWDSYIAIWDKEVMAPTLRNFVRSSTVSGAALRTTGASPAADTPLTDTSAGLGASPDSPDVFFVLQESTFPPALLKPGYKPEHLFADDAAQSGPLKVHTFAGGTWRTEFSVTVQMEPQEFGNDGLYVFHQLEGRIKRSVFTEFKKLGYRTIVFYPVPGSFINAAPFYHSIGIDEFYDPESLGVKIGWNWVYPDSAVYGAMLKKLASIADNRPMAVMVLTINQHGPHQADDPLADYLRRFAASDSAYGDLLHGLAQTGRKAGVVTFGDHQPEFTARYYPDDPPRFITAYEIRCLNFTCAGDPGHKPLDAVMLAPAALERFGFTLDGFSLAQRRAFAACDSDVDRCDDPTRLGLNRVFARYFE